MAATSIRRIHENELHQCAALIRESFLTVASDFGLTKENCPSNGAFLETDRLVSDWENGAQMYGLYHGEVLCGFMELKNKGGGIVTLEKLCVPPHCRHLGYGAQLLDAAKKETAAMGGQSLSIGIMEEHIVLKRWYERHGFASTGTKQFPHLPFLVGFMEFPL